MSLNSPVSILYDVNGNPIGTSTNPLSVQVSGSVTLGGTVQSGSTAVGYPSLVGGADSNGVLRGFLTDTAGKLFVSGSVAVSNTLTVSGSVAITNTVTAAVTGQVQSGSTAAGNPVLVAGSDASSIVRGVRTDVSGCIVVVGTAFSGSTAPGHAPVIIAGTDSTGIVRTLRLSTAGVVQTSAATSSTTSVSSVAASASNVTVLAANASRIGATVFNDSTVTLYLKLGATASTTSYTVQLSARAYYEVPFGYVGIIDGIWDSATGNARVTELTL